MKIPIPLAAALLLAGPAHAHSFNPVEAGPIVCQLKAVGVSQLRAIEIAIQATWDERRPARRALYNGKETTADVLALASYIATRC